MIRNGSMTVPLQQRRQRLRRQLSPHVHHHGTLVERRLLEQLRQRVTLVYFVVKEAGQRKRSGGARGRRRVKVAYDSI